jgi:hypothetical protein
MRHYFHLAFKTIALVAALGLVIGPQTLTTRLEGTAFALWHALGDQLAGCELDAIARQLDRDRLIAERIEFARDRLSARLRSLEAFRACLDTLQNGRCPSLGADSDPELASLDAAIAMLKSTGARASRVLDSVHESVHRRESELLALEAAADVRQVSELLARSTGNTSSWSDAVARAREILGIAVPDSQDWHTPQELSAGNARLGEASPDSLTSSNPGRVTLGRWSTSARCLSCEPQAASGIPSR